MTEVKVIKWQVNWLEFKNLCRTTVNLPDSNVIPSDDWKKDLLLAEHSPLRHSLITIELTNIPYYVTTHLVRHHIGVEKFISTSRADRTGIDRSERRQTDLVNMRMDLNIQALINISRKRLCNQADKTTQKIWLMVIKEVAKFDENIAWACVSECIRTGGCPERFGNCKYFDNFAKNLSKKELIDIKMRYDIYARKRKQRTT